MWWVAVLPSLSAQSAVAALQVPDELHAPIASLKKTAVELGHALSAADCPVIHIKGHSHTFSCYDVGNSVTHPGHTRAALAHR